MHILHYFHVEAPLSVITQALILPDQHSQRKTRKIFLDGMQQIARACPIRPAASHQLQGSRCLQASEYGSRDTSRMDAGCKFCCKGSIDLIGLAGIVTARSVKIWPHAMTYKLQTLSSISTMRSIVPMGSHCRFGLRSGDGQKDVQNPFATLRPGHLFDQPPSVLSVTSCQS